MRRKCLFRSAVAAASVALAVAVLTGCTGNQGTPSTTETTQASRITVAPTGFDGSQWKVVSINGTAPIAGSYLSLYFRGGTVSGFAGVNTFGGHYEVSEPHELRVSDVTLTLLGGPENLVKQEECRPSARMGHFWGH